METRFSQRLTWLMKERKISGQKIGAAVGKSQKTISRYATGEIEPNEQMKNAIYQAIAAISGIEEDGMTEDELEDREFFGKLSEDWTTNPDCIDEQMGLEIYERNVTNEANLCDVFRKLTPQAKKYYLENFDVFHMVEMWEEDVLEFFRNLSASKQEELIKYLENFNFDYKALYNTNKLGAYMTMISNASKRPVLIMEQVEEVREISKQEERMVDEYECRLFDIRIGNAQGEMPYYPWFLSYTSREWYFLLRVQIFELYDKQTCMWDVENGIEVGVMLAHLLDAMR